MKQWLQKYNWYRIWIWIFAIISATAAYADGWWAGLRAALLVWAIYQFGRSSYEHDMSHKVTAIFDEWERNNHVN